MFGQVVSGQVVASIEILSTFRTRVCGGGGGGGGGGGLFFKTTCCSYVML